MAETERLPGAQEAMWRRMQFEKLGFGEADAHELSVSEATVEAARRLLQRGATHDETRRILV